MAVWQSILFIRKAVHVHGRVFSGCLIFGCMHIARFFQPACDVGHYFFLIVFLEAAVLGAGSGVKLYPWCFRGLLSWEPSPGSPAEGHFFFFLICSVPPPLCAPRLDFSLLWSGCRFNSLGDGALGPTGGMETPQPCPGLKTKKGKTFSERTNRYFLSAPSWQRAQPPW